MVVHRGRNIDSLLNQQLLTHMAAGPKPQHLTRSGMRKRERLKRSVRFFAGGLAGLLLSVGAETSRAIYTSQYLKRRNPVLHDKLQNLGDLDLLYFHVEDIVKPFETACMASDKNPAEFNKICEYFFGGL
ncbi:hypothetical protein M3O75_12115 [Klebsiella pneumoniae]|nr:hypothetical protein [Klebsiella pneumoniae]